MQENKEQYIQGVEGMKANCICGNKNFHTRECKNNKFKANKKAYQQTDKYKAYKKAYQQTDKYKAYQKAYYQRKKKELKK